MMALMCLLTLMAAIYEFDFICIFLFVVCITGFVVAIIFTHEDIKWTYKEIGKYISFRLQEGRNGFEKEGYCESKRITSDKYKKGE